jgi:hypothetical protein
MTNDDTDILPQIIRSGCIATPTLAHVFYGPPFFYVMHKRVGFVPLYCGWGFGVSPARMMQQKSINGGTFWFHKVSYWSISGPQAMLGRSLIYAR